MVYLVVILDNFNDVVVIIDVLGMVIIVNKLLYIVFGYLFEEVIGQDVKMLMLQLYSQFYFDYICYYVEIGKVKIIGVGWEVIGKYKSGKEFFIELFIFEVIQDG